MLLAVAIAIKITSPGPVIFRQKRLTAGGRVFTMLKFRSMIDNAEKVTGAVWAAESDPRVTRVGRFIRRTRLDELPQLINVLRGDMSLIGPRPERPELADTLTQTLPSFPKRLAVRAGITGLAQVGQGYAGNVDAYRRKLALDLVYVRKRCFLLDMRIALRTVVVMLTGSGSR